MLTMPDRPPTQIRQWPQVSLNEDVDESIDTLPATSPTLQVPVSTHSANTITIEKRKRKRQRDKNSDRSNRPSMPRLPLEIRSSALPEISLGVPQRGMSVWMKYDKSYEVELNGSVMVAERRSPASG